MRVRALVIVCECLCEERDIERETGICRKRGQRRGKKVGSAGYIHTEIVGLISMLVPESN